MRLLVEADNLKELQNFIQKNGVNFADRYGNRLLHYAVQSGQSKIVDLLLGEDEVDVTVENNEYKNPLDIARETAKDQKIIQALVKKIVDDSLQLLEISSDERKTGEPAPKEPDTTLNLVESRIKQTEDKIKYCLKSVKNLNKENTNADELSSQQAAILIYFLANYALNQNDNEGIRKKVKDRFPQYWKDKDRGEGGSEIPTSLLRFGFDDVCQFIKSPTQLESDVELPCEQTDVLIYIIKMFALEGHGIDDIKNMIKKHFSDNEKLAVSLGLTNVDDFINGDFDSFFKRFQKYVQRAYTQANVLIHFIEAVALEGSGNPKIKDKLKAYFSQYYTEVDRLIFVDARTLLLKDRAGTSENNVKKLGLQDVRKFIKGDVNTFFEQFQKYLEYFKHVQALKCFLKNLEDPVENPRGTMCDCISSLEGKFEIFMKKYDMQGKIKKKELLDYVLHSYPAFQEESSESVKKLKNTETDSFFTKLQRYIQHIQQRNLCIKQLGGEENKKGKKLSDGYFLKGEFEKIIKKSCMTIKRTQEIIFDFTVHLYPEFQQTARGVNKQGSNDSVEKTAEKLINYAKRIQQQNFFLKTLVGNERNLGTGVGDDKCFLQEELETLIKASSRPEAITPELIFNFIVNFYPAFQKVAVGDLEELKELRNELVHEFHKGRSAEFGREIFRLRHELFIFYYVREVQRILNELEGGEETEGIHEYFDSKLKTLNQHFGSSDHGMSSDSPTDKTKSFIWHQFSRSFIPEEPCDVEELVDRYFEFLIFIDSKKMVIENLSEDEEGRNISLSDSNRRAIFEVLDELKRFKEHRQNEDHFDEKHYSDAKNKLRKLVPDDGIQEGRFDDVWKLYETNDTKSFEPECKIITKIINTLKGYKTNYRLADREVITLYDQFVRKSGIFDSDRRNSLSKNQDLVGDKQSIAEELSKCSLNENILLRIGDEEFYIPRGEVVRNILNAFYNAFDTYRIEFDLEKIFDDELFLKSLIKRETGKPDYMIIKILLKLEYTAPYIVRLIKRVNSDKTIEKDDLRKLVKILMTKDHTLYNKYLNELLTIPKGKLDLYQEVYKKICKDSFDIESMRDTFKKPEHVKKILAVVERNMNLNVDLPSQVTLLSDKICKLLCDVVRELINDCYHEEALEILNVESKLISTYETPDHVIVINYKLNIARVKSFMGMDIQKQDENEAKKMFREALEILEEIYIPTDIRDPQLFSVLYHKLYTQSLLQRYDDSCRGYCALYNKIKEYVFDSSMNDTTVLNTRPEEEIYTAINESQAYQELLSLSQEYGVYFNIFSIRRRIAYNKCRSADIAQWEEGLAILKGIYQYENDKFGTDRQPYLQNIRNIAYEHSVVGKAFYKRSKYAEAVEHYEDSLVRHLKMVRIRKNMFDKHIADKQITNYIIKNLRDIANTNNKLGESSNDPEGELSHHEAALTIYTRIYQFQEHAYFSNSIISMTNNKRDLKLSEEEIKHNKRVLNIFEEASKFAKNKQVRKAEYSSKDIISSTKFIIDKLDGLDLSNSPNVANLFRNDVLEYIPLTLKRIAFINEQLGYLKARTQADASGNYQMASDILTLLFEFEQHEYISSSISDITNELHDLKTTTDSQEKLSLQEALKIYKNVSAFGKSKQDVKVKYTSEGILGRIAIIGNELGLLKLSINRKVKLLSDNEELRYTLGTLSYLAFIHTTLGNLTSKDTVKASEHYKKALEIGMVYYKFLEHRYILNTIICVNNELRKPELPEKKTGFYEKVRSIYNDASQLQKSSKAGEGDDRDPGVLMMRIIFISHKLRDLTSLPDAKRQLLPCDEALGSISSTVENIAYAGRRLEGLSNNKDYCEPYSELRTEVLLSVIKSFHEKKPNSEISGLSRTFDVI